MKKLIAIAVTTTVVLSALAQTQHSVNLAWAYPVLPPDSITNYQFNVRASTVLAAPLPWPVVLQVTGTSNATVTTSNTLQFFYLTATNLISSKTNWWAESDPSNTARWQLTPSGQLSIVQ